MAKIISQQKKKSRVLFLEAEEEEFVFSGRRRVCFQQKKKKMYYYRYDSAELAGAAFIAAGFWAWSEKGVLLDLTQVTQLHGFDPVWLVLVVGGVTFILGFAGCVGALRETSFSGVIGFIFVLELTAAVLAVVFQSQVRDWINDFFLANVKAYRDDIDLQNLIDSLQRMNHCCGAQEPDDWDQNVYFSCNGTHRSREKCGVPFSCCNADPSDSVVNTQCGYDVRNIPNKIEWSEHIYTKGCISALEDWLPGNLYTVAIVFIVISLLQMVGIYLARTLISDIEKVDLWSSSVVSVLLESVFWRRGQGHVELCDWTFRNHRKRTSLR
ncbi:hypothetical protein F7725_023549 [Dissostichus mawsoni]|uniref:Tetraspanin-33 n=1 Tax=Dissostichus mawsoni TaxID=36200 RepID=A0A7J5XZQ3_DISMA|nr:hypothetical protein F7725_023549 [Dissostichus mawsoni]